MEIIQYSHGNVCGICNVSFGPHTEQVAQVDLPTKCLVYFDI